MKNSLSYYFIVNPVSGRGKGKKVAAYIQELFESRKRKFIIQFTEKTGDAPRLVKNGVDSGYDIIVAVGGDGTINEIVNELVGSNRILGVIPTGSGNGFARDLEIPLNIKAAARLLLSGSEKSIDIGVCNNQHFVCTAGIGFDAHMGEKFKNLESRGLVGYIKTFIHEFFSYNPEEYILINKGKEIKKEAFLITVANCRQWGNNFYISPKSKNNDGLLEICIIRKFPKIIFPVLAYRLMTKTIEKSRYFEAFSTDSIQITSERSFIFHTDGEPKNSTNSIEIYTKSSQLRIISTI